MAGVTYTLTFTIDSISAGGARVAITGGTAVSGTTRTAPGTYTQDFVALTGNVNINIQAMNNGALTAQFDNFSVKKK